MQGTHAGVVEKVPSSGIVEKPLMNESLTRPGRGRFCRGRIHAALVVGEKTRDAYMRPLHMNKFSLSGFFNSPLKGGVKFNALLPGLFQQPRKREYIPPYKVPLMA